MADVADQNPTWQQAPHGSTEQPVGRMLGEMVQCGRQSQHREAGFVYLSFELGRIRHVGLASQVWVTARTRFPDHIGWP